jgi:uncharacterized protein YfaT (DUF1175 family)
VLRRFSLALPVVISCLFFAGCGHASQASDRDRSVDGGEIAGATPAKAAATGRQAEACATCDDDRDGIPDRAELRSFDDRQNFRSWFTAIAEMQFYTPSSEWSSEQRDCAGLVRFSMREALRRHDRPWFKRVGAEYEAIAPDVKSTTLEKGLLGEKLFRTDYGEFQQGDLDNGRLSEFADARTLKNFNTVFVSRDRRRAEPGDLLFFHEPRNTRYPYHVMIFIGEARHAGEGEPDFVVYHTGSSPADNGTVKLVRLTVLDQHPDQRWRPVESNQNFLGFYRLKILN